MNPTLTALVASLCGGLAAWAVTSAQPSTSAGAPGAGVQLAAGPDRPEALLELTKRIDALSADLTELRMAPVAPARRDPGPEAEALDLGSVEAAVRRLVEDGSLREASPAESVTWPGGFDSPLAAVASILDLGLDSEEASALWREAAANGQLHELLATLEAELEGQPETSDKHVTRARAYYAAARAYPSNVDGNWWVDSDDAYTKALELDPQHWEARYNKARNQSFWPTAYGGQAEAIRHFEILVGQQESSPPQDKFSESYVWLGNLYDQQGRTEEARQAWERGLQAFPGDDWLMKKLATLPR